MVEEWPQGGIAALMVRACGMVDSRDRPQGMSTFLTAASVVEANRRLSLD